MTSANMKFTFLFIDFTNVLLISFSGIERRISAFSLMKVKKLPKF